MQTEQSTKCLYHISYGGRITSLSPPPGNLLPTVPRWLFCCGSYRLDLYLLMLLVALLCDHLMIIRLSALPSVFICFVQASTVTT